MNKHHRSLELNKVLEMLAQFAGCEDTKTAARGISPCTDYAKAVRLLHCTSDAHMLSNRFGTPSIYKVVQCDDAIKRAKVGGGLTRRELLDIAYILKTTRNLITWRKQAGDTITALDDIFQCLFADKFLEDRVAECISQDEEILDTASSELRDIRRKMLAASANVRNQLDKLIRSTTNQKFLQEQIVTLRNGRFVVPVKSEYRGEIKGIVHDTSSSGSTIFIEPIAVVEANNQIRELESMEHHEINRILQELSVQVGDIATELLGSYELIILLDLYFAKTRLADSMKASVPILIEHGMTNLKKARHPLISGEKIVPIDIFIGGDFDTLVVTGPNTGGKTVALKTLGLLSLMAMCGLLIPAADESTVCVYKNILADIGDEQSIEQSLSTFSGHMTNIVSILEIAEKGTLVLIDELGAGTDPIEGAALAIAIIGKLRANGACVAASTHYAEIKVFALQTSGVENASCEFDLQTLRPTYKLLIGVPGRSNAFAISKRLGLSDDIIDVAKAQISTDNTRFEDVVSGLEYARQQLEKEKISAQNLHNQAHLANEKAAAMLENLEKEKDAELQKARDKARQMVEQVKFQSQALLEELEQLKKQKDKQDFSATVTDVKSTFKAYVRELEDTANPVTQKKESTYRLPRPLKRGDRVLLADFGTQGTVLAPPDSNGNVSVQAGIIKTKVKLSSVRLVEDKDSKNTYAGGAVNTRSAVASAKESASSEVDLRGMDSGEALMVLERYLDTAVLSNIKNVTIIHGKGTGVLRTSVARRLRAHKAVRTFRLGVYGEGESGVTIAELK